MIYTYIYIYMRVLTNWHKYPKSNDHHSDMNIEIAFLSWKKGVWHGLISSSVESRYWFIACHTRMMMLCWSQLYIQQQIQNEQTELSIHLVFSRRFNKQKEKERKEKAKEKQRKPKEKKEGFVWKTKETRRAARRGRERGIAAMKWGGRGGAATVRSRKPPTWPSCWF